MDSEEKISKNEEISKSDEPISQSTNEKKSSNIGIIIFIIILISALLGIVVYVTTSIFNVGKQIHRKSGELVENVGSKFVNNVINDDSFNNLNEKMKSYDEEFERDSFNMKIENVQGTQSKFMLSSYLDRIVTSNKTNEDHVITVVYNETATTTEDGIVGIKHSLVDNNKYEVSVDYDENKYINKITIKDM